MERDFSSLAKRIDELVEALAEKCPELHDKYCAHLTLASVVLDAMGDMKDE